MLYLISIYFLFLFIVFYEYHLPIPTYLSIYLSIYLSRSGGVRQGHGPDRPEVGAEGPIQRRSLAGGAHHWAADVHIRDHRHVQEEDRRAQLLFR